MLRAFECNVKGREWQRTVHALTRSKARYEYWCDVREAWPDLPIMAIEVRSMGPPVSSSKLLRVADYRGLPFVRAGMLVEAGGHRGQIVDGNDSANFDVIFLDGPSKGQTHNCHPHDEMAYFDGRGNVLADFRRPR